MKSRFPNIISIVGGDVAGQAIIKKVKKITSSQYTELVFIFVLLAAAMVLFLCNLGNHYLWQDEAQTALISKTILTQYVPRGSDGKNSFSQELGADYGENYIWRWHPWLPFYIIAGFFKVFGVSTFAARLPSALFGIATVFLTYFFCKSVWENKLIAAMAAVFVLLSIPFLLLSRQCRYYSMATFFSLWNLYAYTGIIKEKKGSSAAFIVSLVLLFHIYYAYFAALIATIFLHTLLFHRDRLKTVLLTIAASVIVIVPWIFWLHHIGYDEVCTAITLKMATMVKHADVYITQIVKYIFCPYLLLIIPAVIVVRWRIAKSFGSAFPGNAGFWRNLLLMVFFVFFYVAILSVATIAPFFRYLAPIIPVLAISMALLIFAAWLINPTAAVGIVIILIFTSNLKDFVYEITHDYEGPIKGIVKYLNENGSESDTVAITYGDMPLKFYTKMRVVGGLTGEDISPAPQAEWIILRKYVINDYNITVMNYLLKNMSRDKYEKIVINYPDLAWENREDPAEHNYRTVVDEQRVVIFHRAK